MAREPAAAETRKRPRARTARASETPRVSRKSRKLGTPPAAGANIATPTLGEPSRLLLVGGATARLEEIEASLAGSPHMLRCTESRDRAGLRLLLDSGPWDVVVAEAGERAWLEPALPDLNLVLAQPGVPILPALQAALDMATLRRERDEARRQAAEVESRFSAFMDHSPTVAFLKDEEGRYVYTSEPFRRTLRPDPDGWLGRTDFDLWPQEVAARLRRNDQTVLGSDQPDQAFETVPMPGGTQHTWLMYRFPYTDASGRRLLAGKALDVTDLKRTEGALQATQERLERVLASSPTVIYAFAVEGDGGLTWVSRNLTTLLGYSVEEALVSGWWNDHVHPDDRASASANLSLLFSQGHLTHEYRFRQRDGGYLWIRDDSRLRRDVKGKALEVFGSWADITQRREAEAVLERAKADLEARVSERTAELSEANERLKVELAERRRAEDASRHSEARLGIVAQATSDAIWDWDLGTNRVWWNQGVQTLFGYAPSEVGSEVRWWLERLHREDRDRIWQNIEQTMRGGGNAWSTEYRMRRADGSYASVLDRGQVIRDDADKPVRLIGSILDITERKRSEEALRQANEKLTAWVAELEQRNREMSLLGEMGELLQTCTAASEAYDVIRNSLQQLFHGESGALYVFRAGPNQVEASATWGDSPADDPGFEADECWALRRGRPHFVEDAHSGLRCPHVKHAPAGGYLCIPMMAQTEALGVLHLRSHGARLSEARRLFAQTVSESLALGLANLKLREALQRQAIRDPLTGLFNRRHMEDALEREVRRASRRVTPLCVLMLDLDNFKALNDSMGHEAGDALLRAIGEFLQSRVRAADIACRYGGEEITLILPDATLADARQRAEDLREAVKRIAVKDRGRSIGNISVSVGLASFPDHGTSSEALLRAADAALYRAKERGRDCVVSAGES